MARDIDIFIAGPQQHEIVALVERVAGGKANSGVYGAPPRVTTGEITITIKDTDPAFARAELATRDGKRVDLRRYPHWVEVRHATKAYQVRRALADRLAETIRTTTRWAFAYVDTLQTVIDARTPETE